jgi:MoxR-like ATPase
MTVPPPSEALTRIRAVFEAVAVEVRKAIVGQDEVLEQVLAAILAGGHVLLEGLPGTAKTLLVRSLSIVLHGKFSRVQFTPDLMPADITGTSVFNPEKRVFEFRPGPIFADLLLADEINRAPAKTQAALLEAMQERRVTADGTSHRLPAVFTTLATQNPIEYEGTYPLPEAQLDRFLVRLRVGYPGAEEEWRMLDARARRGTDTVALNTVVTREGLLELQAAVEAVYVGEAVGRYMVELTTATRESSEVEVGASPRGTLALLRLARARAALEGRDFVVPDDVKQIAVAALAHRLVLRPELWVRRIDADAVLARILQAVPAPPAIEPDDDERRRVADAR